MTDHKCNTVLKAGRVCGSRAKFYNPMKQEYYCSRHNTLSSDEVKRINSNYLCQYGKDGLAFYDIDSHFESIEADPIGDEAIKLLKGYINIRIGSPLLFESMPLVYMSKIQGYGDNFDRKSLAKCLKDSIEYILSRKDIYAIQSDVDLFNLRLMSIRYDTYYGHYVAELERHETPITL